MSARRKDPFAPGVRLAGLVVLAIEAPAAPISKTLYRVRYDCCGRDGTLTHEVVIKRRRSGTTLCQTCAQLKSVATKRQPPTSLLVEDQPAEKRKAVPSAREVIAWHDRATEIVRARRAA